MHYLFLLIAVALEVSGTMLLPVSQNFTRPIPTLGLIGATRPLLLLDLRPEHAADRGGLRDVVGSGDFLITLFGYLVFDQTLDWRVVVGLLLIVAGVVLVNSSLP